MFVVYVGVNLPTTKFKYFKQYTYFTTWWAHFRNQICDFKVLHMPQVYALCSLLTRTEVA